jgi:hypothetical protein
MQELMDSEELAVRVESYGKGATADLARLGIPPAQWRSQPRRENVPTVVAHR